MSWLGRYRVNGRVNLTTGNWTETLGESRRREQEELRSMASVNLVILVGNLGADPEVRYTQAGKAFCKLSIATTDEWTDPKGVRQKKTEWHRVTIWGKQAENVGKYLKKGSSIYIEGSIQTNKYQDAQGQDRWSTEVMASTTKFMSSAPRNNQPPAGAERYDHPEAAPQVEYDDQYYHDQGGM